LERWNSNIKGKGFENNAGMNSFNHYAFGSVNEWMFGNMAGIKVNQAGYRTFTIKPEIAKEGITYVKATYHSINGEIVSSWKKENQQLILDLVVPVNTQAEIYIPCKNNGEVKENGNVIKNNNDIIIKGYKDGYLLVSAGSGTYHFKSQL